MTGYSKDKGFIQTTTSPQTLFEFTEDKHYSFKLFIQNLQSGDTIQVNVYMWDEIDASYQLYSTDEFSGTESDKVKHFAFTFESKIKVTIHRTNGNDRQINYSWVKANP